LVLELLSFFGLYYLPPNCARSSYRPEHIYENRENDASEVTTAGISRFVIF